MGLLAEGLGFGGRRLATVWDPDTEVQLPQDRSQGLGVQGLAR